VSGLGKLVTSSSSGDAGISDEKGKYKRNSGSEKAVRDKEDGKTTKGEGEEINADAQSEKPVSWQEKAMRLKGKLNRMEGQLARERKEKNHINDILAKRDEELAHLQRQIAPIFALESEDGESLDDRLLLNENITASGALPLALAERVSTRTLIARSARRPKTFLTPFFEWWQDMNGRPDGGMGDLNLKAWWTAVTVLLLSVFLQLWWRTVEEPALAAAAASPETSSSPNLS
jgi:hypothetical protein